MIYIRGGNKQRRELVKRIYDDLIPSLFQNSLQKDVYVILRKNLSVDGYSGYDLDENLNICFEVEINNKLNEQEFIKTVLHEFRHVWQYHSGLLIHYTDGNVYSGKTYPLDFNYDDSPWEIDAKKFEDFYVVYLH